MIFRRTDKYGYSRYYGGGGPALVIKIIVTVIVVIAVVLGVAAFSLQKYMVYTENGGHLELPWDKKTSVSDDISGGVTVDPLDSAAGDVSGEPGQTAEGADTSADASAPVDGAADADAPEDASSQKENSTSGGFLAWLKKLFHIGENQQQAENPDSVTSASPTEDENLEPDISAVVDDTPEPDGSAPADEPETEQPPVAETLPDGALIQHVSIGDVTSGYAAGDIQKAKGNGMLLYIKESSGKLNYDSQLAIAAELDVVGTSSTNQSVVETVAELKEDGIYTVAYVDCFQDQAAGEGYSSFLFDEDGDPWYDGESRAWADPADEEFQDYLVSVVSDLLAIGYDEIVLNNAGYPTTGETKRLSADCYDPAGFANTVNGFYAKLAEATKDSETVISVITTEDAILNGQDETTGQTLENMKQLGGRLWVEGGDTAAMRQALADAGYPENALGLLVSGFDSENQLCQMNLD